MSSGKAAGGAPGRVRKSSLRPDESRPAERRRLANRAAMPVAGIPDEELTPRVRTVVSTLIDEVERLRRDLELSQRQMAELASMADADPLLGMLNRRAFMRELERAAAYARRYGTLLSVVYLDLDDFKLVNDRHGHAAGDAVLRHVGTVLDASVRKSDIIGRMGGDEFAVALVGTGIEDARRKAARLVEAVVAPVTKERRCAGLKGLSLSVGVTELADGDTVDALIDRADRAMYGAKRSRRR